MSTHHSKHPLLSYFRTTCHWDSFVVLRRNPRLQPLVFFAFNSPRRAFGACDTDAGLPSAARARPKLLRL